MAEHEVRELKWKLKQLAKQCGKQGSIIHNLRLEITSLRYTMQNGAQLVAENERLRNSLGEVVRENARLRNSLAKKEEVDA